MSTKILILTGSLRDKIKIVLISPVSFRDLRHGLSQRGYLLPEAEDSFLHRLVVRRGEFIYVPTILFPPFSHQPSSWLLY